VSESTHALQFVLAAPHFSEQLLELGILEAQHVLHLHYARVNGLAGRSLVVDVAALHHAELVCACAVPTAPTNHRTTYTNTATAVAGAQRCVVLEGRVVVVAVRFVTAAPDSAAASHGVPEAAIVAGRRVSDVGNRRASGRTRLLREKVLRAVVWWDVPDVVR
jgi:hypothetical protein